MKLINLKDIKGPKQQLCAEDDLLKVYYLEFDKGSGLPNHSLNGVGVLQVLEGHIVIEFDTNEKFDMVKDQLLEFKTSIVHNIKALEHSKVLIINASYSN